MPHTIDQPEAAVQFACEGETLRGIAHLPDGVFRRGVVMITGGPQYRAGSHRQFTLLARKLAADGHPVLRFDYRGMGDSDGEPRSFESVDADVRAAIDALLEHAPALEEVVLWGLCDAASAASLYAPRDVRVAGVVLLNPWVRTDSGLAEAYVKHYYGKRIFDPELWRKIVRGEFKFVEAGNSFFETLRRSRESPASAPFPRRMLEGLRRFSGKTLLILSGNDLVAAEFTGLVAQSREWQQFLSSPRTTRRDLAPANHTFAKSEWRARVEDWTLEWLRSW